jgi:two-component system CheB/CheR fusion protein
LRPGGYLFLGSSETIDGNTLFRIVDRDTRIYQALERPRDKLPPLPRILTGPTIAEPPSRPVLRRSPSTNDMSMHRQALEATAPPSIMIDETHQIVTLSETAGRFLRRSDDERSS